MRLFPVVISEPSGQLYEGWLSGSCGEVIRLDNMDSDAVMQGFSP